MFLFGSVYIPIMIIMSQAAECGEFKREGSSKAKGQGGQGEVCWISRCQVSADIARILPHRPGASKVHSETDREFEVQNLGDVDL